MPEADYRRRSIVGGVVPIGVPAGQLPGGVVTPGAPPTTAGRWYFESDGSAQFPPQTANPPVSPAFTAAWGVTAAAVRRHLSPGGLTLNTPLGGSPAIAETSAVAVDVLFGQFVSGPLAAQVIDGTVRGQMLALEDQADADLRAQIVIKVVSNDGLTVRGTLLAADDASALSSEFAVGGYTNRKFPLAATSPATLTPVTLVDGDRLVVELGYRAHNVLTGSRQAQFWYGTSASTDLPEDETSGANVRPWIEFSTTTFGGIILGTTGAAGTVLRDTQTLVEAGVSVVHPVIRVTQMMVEAVVEEFWHGFGIIGDDNDDVAYANANPVGDAPVGGAAASGRGRSDATGS